MQKENLSTIGLIAFLFVLILVAVYLRKEQELVVTRPDLTTVVSQTLETLGGGSGSSESGAVACPAGCVAQNSANSTTTKQKPSDAQKEAWRADPATHVSEVLRTQFAKQILQGELEQGDFTNDQLWWRSDEENYRILVAPAKTTGYQVPTTATAGELAPKKPTDKHPAARHPLLKKVIKAVNKEMSKLGYKKSAFATCPVNEAYDPFNNCLATYTRDDHKCTLIAGYGRLDRQASVTPYLRLELSCSDAYEASYHLAAPYLYTLNLVNPEWLVPDMAVYQVEELGDWSRVNFGNNYGIFQKVEQGYKLVAGGDINNPVTCLTAQTFNIPQEVYQSCR